MSDMPERIWATPENNWVEQRTWRLAGDQTEYIHIDKFEQLEEQSAHSPYPVDDTDIDLAISKSVDEFAYYVLIGCKDRIKQLEADRDTWEREAGELQKTAEHYRQTSRQLEAELEDWRQSFPREAEENKQ